MTKFSSARAICLGGAKLAPRSCNRAKMSALNISSHDLHRVCVLPSIAVASLLINDWSEVKKLLGQLRLYPSHGKKPKKQVEYDVDCDENLNVNWDLSKSIKRGYSTYDTDQALVKGLGPSYMQYFTASQNPSQEIMDEMITLLRKTNIVDRKENFTPTLNFKGNDKTYVTSLCFKLPSGSAMGLYKIQSDGNGHYTIYSDTTVAFKKVKDLGGNVIWAQVATDNENIGNILPWQPCSIVLKAAADPMWRNYSPREDKFLDAVMDALYYTNLNPIVPQEMHESEKFIIQVANIRSSEYNNNKFFEYRPFVLYSMERYFEEQQSDNEQYEKFVQQIRHLSGVYILTALHCKDNVVLSKNVRRANGIESVVEVNSSIIFYWMQRDDSKIKQQNFAGSFTIDIGNQHYIIDDMTIDNEIDILKNRCIIRNRFTSNRRVELEVSSNLRIFTTNTARQCAGQTRKQQRCKNRRCQRPPALCHWHVNQKEQLKNLPWWQNIEEEIDLYNSMFT